MVRYFIMFGTILIFGLLTVEVSYCGEPAKASDVKVQPPATAETSKNAKTTAVKDETETSKPLVSGKVIETMNSGRYTYMLLEKDGRKGWVAVPGMHVKVGEQVQLNPGVEMGKFTSNTLHRTFDQIVFTSAPGTNEHELLMQVNTNKGETALPSGHPLMEKPNVDKEKWAPINGKVVETMDSGGYTYICLEKEGKKTWAAVPTMKVKIGDTLELKPGATMTNFSSKTLNRTFESIIFSAGPVSKK
jgi:hypothetical protein